jgi:hypothetical protein
MRITFARHDARCMKLHEHGDVQDQLDARMEEDADAGMPPDPGAAAAFEVAKAWVLPRVSSGFRLLAGTVLPPELLTAVMVGTSDH